jgi:enediyne biosynthesis protein E4
VAVGDYNNDGFDDIFLSGWAENVLYRNNGDGTFTDVTREAGLPQDKSRWDRAAPLLITTATDCWIFSWPGTWSSILRWRRFPEGRHTQLERKRRALRAEGLPPGATSLYRNRGDRTFTDWEVS